MQEFKDWLQEARDKGYLQEGMKRGLFSHIPITYLDIYNNYVQTNRTYRQLSKAMRVSIFTIHRAVTTFRN